MSETIPFASSDGWLLHAILIAAKDGEATLEAIVAAADMINHAMLTFDELDGGLARLSRAGLVLVRGKSIRTTAAAAKIFATAGKFSIHKATEALRAQVGIPQPAPPFKPTPRDPNWSSGAFTLADLVEADTVYRRRLCPAMPASSL